MKHKSQGTTETPDHLYNLFLFLDLLVYSYRQYQLRGGFMSQKADDAIIKHSANQISIEPIEGMTARNTQEALLETFLLGNSRKKDVVDKLLLVENSLPINHESTWSDILLAIEMITTGKRWASGSGVGSGDGLFTVADLTFTPSTVVIRWYSGSTVFERVFCNLIMPTENAVFSKGINYYTSGNPSSMGGTYNAGIVFTVNNVGFSVTINANATNVQWVAFE